jgi:hypothetical protein
MSVHDVEAEAMWYLQRGIFCWLVRIYIYTIRKPASSTHDSARFAHEGSEAYEGCGETERQLRGARTYHGSGCRYEAVIKEQKRTDSEL